MMRLKNWLLCFFLPVAFITGSLLFSTTTQAQELKNVITDIKLWDSGNNIELRKIKVVIINLTFILTCLPTMVSYKMGIRLLLQFRQE